MSYRLLTALGAVLFSLTAACATDVASEEGDEANEIPTAPVRVDQNMRPLEVSSPSPRPGSLIGDMLEPVRWKCEPPVSVVVNGKVIQVEMCIEIM